MDNLDTDSLPPLNELIDRASLSELLELVHGLAGPPVELLSPSGAVLARAGARPLGCERPFHEQGSELCDEAAPALLEATLDSGDPVAVSCSAGLRYLVVAVAYGHDLLGRIVVGPFLDGAREHAPSPEQSARQARERCAGPWDDVVRADPGKLRRMTKRLSSVLDLLIFCGHKVYLTSRMHLASTRESYRELAAKNEQLLESYERLRELDRLKSHFLASVSHELRTPLTSIIGYAEVLTEGLSGPMSEEQQRFVATIRENGERLLGLISSLLDFSQLEAGRLSLHLSRTAVGDLIGDAVAGVRLEAERRSVSVVSRVDPDLPELLVDRARIGRALYHLVDNAVKFSSGGGTVWVAASLEAVPSEQATDLPAVLADRRLRAVKIEVADQGVGIPPELRERVFEAFYQVGETTTREHGGAGIGLALVKKTIEAHGGAVEIQSEPGRGTTVTLRLPAGFPTHE